MSTDIIYIIGLPNPDGSVIQHKTDISSQPKKIWTLVTVKYSRSHFLTMCSYLSVSIIVYCNSIRQHLQICLLHQQQLCNSNRTLPAICHCLLPLTGQKICCSFVAVNLLLLPKVCGITCECVCVCARVGLCPSDISHRAEDIPPAGPNYTPCPVTHCTDRLTNVLW